MENKTLLQILSKYGVHIYLEDEDKVEEAEKEFVLQQLSQRKKTLQECKEEVAKRRGYLNWLEALTINWSGDHHIFWNELCELYLQSNQSGWSDEDMVLFAMFNYKRHQFTTKDNLEEFKNFKEEALNYIKSK